MARPPRLKATATKLIVVRLAAPEGDELIAHVLSRYPSDEWATFAHFGWRSTPAGLILTLAALDKPRQGELDSSVRHVAFSEPYSLREALGASSHPLAIGVVHSHPEDCIPCPSAIDDDMDGYFANYFSGFAENRPYVSLIVSRIDGELTISGRVYWEGRWHTVTKVCFERTPVVTWTPTTPRAVVHSSGRHQRLVGALGDRAEQRLRSSAVAIIGAGGTGSAAIEVLTRAGVGKLVVVDPDRLSLSNLERVHGSRVQHVDAAAYKVHVAQEHVRDIDPACKFVGVIGSLPQPSVIDEILDCDVLLGCTDSQHSRLAISDLAVRYLVPSLDCGVTFEGARGRVSGQVAQFTRFLASDPCALCRSMIDPVRLSQELMSTAERDRRMAAAQAARRGGEDPNPYWRNEVQLNTVGYHTTMAGAMVAGYAIGWITGTFDPPFDRLQMNLVAPLLETVDVEQAARPGCTCRRVRGWADQGAADALITPPHHWPAPVRVV